MAGSLTYADLERLPDDGNRYELIGGELYVTPPPINPHQDAAAAIISEFRNHAERTGGWAFVAPTGLYFSDRDFVEPDVMYVAADRLNVIEERDVRGAPTIAVEVLSPSTMRTDRTKKSSLYATFGVPEFWLVDVDTRTVEVRSLPRRGEYTAAAGYSDGSVISTVVEGLSIPLERIFLRPPHLRR
jgi:Uma2 family endonuclease